MYRHILIPTDGSELAHKAETHGCSRSRLERALPRSPWKLHLMCTMYLCRKCMKCPARLPRMRSHAKAHATKILSTVADAAKAAGVPCETMQIVQDHPYEAIVTTAKDKGCDLIVMASHGRTGIAAIVLGSVTTKVLTHTSIPVLVWH
jgi:nucleotide-binding universal stress UspA family protein